MRVSLAGLLSPAIFCVASAGPPSLLQTPLTQTPRQHEKAAVSAALFAELEELSRLVDISYCVGSTGLGVSKPFSCLSRCADFPSLELVTTWNTGVLLSDSCGYLALDHGQRRILVAFRGTYSIANTVIDLSTIPQEYVPYPGDEQSGERSPPASPQAALWPPTNAREHEFIDAAAIKPSHKCQNCTVHMGFHRAWRNTRAAIISDLETQVQRFPDYRVNLVGHSLGGAVAALAGLDLQSHGWNPVVTTFGEPRIGNTALAQYLDETFHLSADRSGHEDGNHGTDNDVPASSVEEMQYRRVTHVDDPVPLLPLTEWGYAMHAGEIFISKSSLSPDIPDLRVCKGDNDPLCIAGQDATITEDGAMGGLRIRALPKRDLLASVRHELDDVRVEPWGIPTRYKLWQLFFAHRDYFWRLGLCVPGGDPWGGGRKYGRPQE